MFGKGASQGDAMETQDGSRHDLHAMAQPGGALETAVLGGGCFWCTEAALSGLRGVSAVTSGYCGGHVASPSYEQVCRGDTGHIEVVQVTFDPAQIAYADLLMVFLASHDPTSLDRQGADAGPQYRSAIFWQTDVQRDQAQALIDDLDQRNVFGKPIVTVLLPPATFWPAEPEHHDYFQRNPWQGYCQVVIAPKLAKVRQSFAGLYDDA